METEPPLRDDARPPRMKHRKLRIAWSVACWIFGMAFLILWIRSQYWVDTVDAPLTSSTFVRLGTLPGTLVVGFSGGTPEEPWKLSSVTVAQFGVRTSGANGRFKIKYASSYFPFWLLILAASVVGAAPWIKWPGRFSLSAMLIATALVAAALGLAMWASEI